MGSHSRSSPAPFLTKTYEMVEDPSSDVVISWNESGSCSSYGVPRTSQRICFLDTSSTTTFPVSCASSIPMASARSHQTDGSSGTSSSAEETKTSSATSAVEEAPQHPKQQLTNKTTAHLLLSPIHTKTNAPPSPPLQNPP